MAENIVQIFVSSTWLDLQPERAVVEQVIHKLRETKFVGMEYFGSREETPRDVSLQEVERSQLYIGIFGARHGSGITADEYHRARDLGLPCLVYFKQDSAIADQNRETDPAKAAALRDLKAELRREHVLTEFDSADSLAAKVATDLHRWLVDEFLTPKLQAAARGNLTHSQASPLLEAIQDPGDFDPALLEQLRGCGYVIASGPRSVAIGGNVSNSRIITGDNNVGGDMHVGGDYIGRDRINQTGDSNVVGSGNTVNISKTSSGATLAEFTQLIAQLRRQIEQAPLDGDTCQEALDDLQKVEAQVANPQPKSAIIQSKLKSVETLLASAVAIGTASQSLASMLQKAIEWAGYLFR
jgi:hypothetical protein